MLSPLALKLSVPNTVVKAASVPNSGTKPGIQNDLSSAVGQFGAELAAVIKETSGKADAQGPTNTLPGLVAQGMVKQPEARAAGQIQTPPVVPVPAVSTPLPVPFPPAIPEPAKTTPLAIPSGSESTKTVSGDRTMKKKDEKEDEQPAPQPYESAPAVPIQTLTAQAIPVPVSLPPISSSAEDNQRTSGKDGDVSGILRPVVSAVPLLTSVPASIPMPKDLPLEPSAIVPASTQAETEAFSLRLQPKTISAANSAIPGDAPKQEASGQSKPGKNGPMAQAGKPDRITSSPAITGASTTPSTLGQPVSIAKISGANRETEQRDKEGLPTPKLAAGDARESKPSFADIASTATAPAAGSFVRETKSAGEIRDVPSIAQPIEVENNPAVVGAAKEVAIRLQNQSGETINVKLIDQGGQLQVTVRSSDPEAASALRQDLSSLTSNLDKAGWKPEVPLAMSGGSFEPVNQTRQTDRDSQDTPSQRQAEWQQETPRKRHSVADAWDEILTNQTV